MLAMAITEMSARNLVVITQSVEKRSDCSQWICDEAGNVIETHEHAGEFREAIRSSVESKHGRFFINSIERTLSAGLK